VRVWSRLQWLLGRLSLEPLRKSLTQDESPDSMAGVDSNSTHKVVVGLGNPGAKYEGTRHNVGFEVLNRLRDLVGSPSLRTKHEGQLTTATFEQQQLTLVWPLTYMNLSGRCVKPIVDFYKINCQQNLLIVCDDISLPVGKLRMRARGSAGGQKGLSDILKVHGTQDIPRLRVGVGSPPPQWDAADFVLGRFSKDERPAMDVAVREAAEAVLLWYRSGIDVSMNKIN
jgi:peptidyl-tRNA hydrolase, PTH1 family